MTIESSIGAARNTLSSSWTGSGWLLARRHESDPPSRRDLRCRYGGLLAPDREGQYFPSLRNDTDDAASIANMPSTVASPLRTAWLRPKQIDLIPIKGSSARVSTIRSAIVVRQRFFWIRATDTDIISAQHFWTGGLGTAGPGAVAIARAAVSECW